MLSVVMLGVIMLSVVMLSIIILRVVMLSVIMLSVVMLNGVRLDVVAPLSCLEEALNVIVRNASPANFYSTLNKGATTFSRMTSG